MSIPLSVSLEANKRLGQGFQIHVESVSMNFVYDQEPLTMSQAAAYANQLVNDFNKRFGTRHELQKIMRISTEALEANAGTDIQAARLLQDIQSKNYEFIIPAKPEYQTAVIDGEEDILLSGSGVVLYCYCAWKEEKTSQAKEALQNYCEYISLHGYQGGAKKALKELLRLNMERGTEWIRRTYARHVEDDKALIEYVLGLLDGPEK